MASRSKTDLHFILASAYDKAVVKYIQNYSATQPFITCTYRSNEEQEKLFLQRPKVTQARGGQSPHNYNPSLAFDLGFLTLDKKLNWDIINFRNFADIIKEIEPLVEWGGDWKFKDSPHYQLLNWKNYLPVINKI